MSVNTCSKLCFAVLAGLLLRAGGVLAQEPRTAAPNALQGFSQNRDQTMRIDAPKLVLRDTDKVATFSGDSRTGDVKFALGDTVMRSNVLVVVYGADEVFNKPQSVSHGASLVRESSTGGSRQIRRLEARGNVIVTRHDQTVTGDNGLIDNEANTVTMRGNVVLTQGQNVARADALVFDLNTGASRLYGGDRP